jgi:phytol kinase
VTLREWLSIAAVLTGLLLGLPVIRMLTLRLGAGPEVSRKAVHVAMGLACAAFPWIFERPLPVWILAALATVPLILLRAIPALKTGVGSALHGVGRPSYGEVLFAPSVAAVFHLSQGQPLLHLIPVGILTLADAAGALAGTRWGTRSYACGDGFKTIEGSFVFLLAAFFCVFLPLVFLGNMEPVRAIWIGLTLGLLAMMAEGLADRGFDNLIIPLGCFFILSRLMELETTALAGRFLAAAVMMAIVLTGSRWSTLSGGALLGSALLGYGCAVMGDWRFLLPPLGIFVCHLATTRKNRLVGVFDHRLDAVLAHAIGCLPWVILAERGVIDHLTGLAGLSFAMAVQLGMLDMATHWWLKNRPAALGRSVTKGWLFAAVPGLVWFWPEYGRLLIPVMAALVSTSVAVAIFRRVKPQEFRHPTRLWLVKGFTALLASLPALMLEKH